MFIRVSCPLTIVIYIFAFAYLLTKYQFSYVVNVNVCPSERVSQHAFSFSAIADFLLLFFFSILFYCCQSALRLFSLLFFPIDKKFIRSQFGNNKKNCATRCVMLDCWFKIISHWTMSTYFFLFAFSSTILAEWWFFFVDLHTVCPLNTHSIRK